MAQFKLSYKMTFLKTSNLKANLFVDIFIYEIVCKCRITARQYGEVVFPLFAIKSGMAHFLPSWYKPSNYVTNYKIPESVMLS